MEEVSDEEIEQLEQELLRLSQKKSVDSEIQKLKKIERTYLYYIIDILLKKDIDYLDNLYRKLNKNHIFR